MKQEKSSNGLKSGALSKKSLSSFQVYWSKGLDSRRLGAILILTTKILLFDNQLTIALTSMLLSPKYNDDVNGWYLFTKLLPSS